MEIKFNAYVLNELYNEVVIIDLGTHKEAGRINRENVSGGGGIVLISNKGFAYCTNCISQNISCIDTIRNKVVGNPIVLPEGYTPKSIAADPDGQYVYVIGVGKYSKLYKISTVTNEIEGNGIFVGDNPSSIAITPNGKLAYVTNYNSNDVSVINFENNVEYRISGINSPTDVAIDHYNGHAYVVSDDSSGTSLYRITVGTDEVDPICSGFSLCSIVLNYGSTTAYVVDNNGMVRIINVFDFTVSPKIIPVGKRPTKIMLAYYNVAYVTNCGSGNIDVINLMDNKVIKTISVGGYPYDIDSTFILVGEPVDVSITKIGKPNPVKIGNELTYTMVVQNNGQAEAGSVILRDTLPLSVNYISAKTSKGFCCFNDGVVKAYLYELYPGEATTVDIVVVPQQEGVIINKASVTSFQENLNLNNTVVEETTVISNSVCIEANKIFDSCTTEGSINFHIELLRDNMLKSIYDYIDKNKQYSSCSIKEITVSVVEKTEPDKEGKINARIKVEGVLTFEISDGKEFFEKYEEAFSSTRVIILYAPKETEICCSVDVPVCKFNWITNWKAYFTINIILAVESRALVKMKVPFLGECDKKTCVYNYNL
jgi:uncharacterized repeat protein (TIGR01451 family)